jgi:2-polyprenyl-3-methyl-5-hydroxy-6-metoxy-1,4-benzoquinol methylase
MSLNQLKDKKFLIQENQYSFPYHYLPHFNEKGIPKRHRSLTWGFEYLCYLMHVESLVDDVNPNSVLEVGCGDGRLTGILAAKYPNVLGVDISEKAILLAQGIHNKEIFKAIDAAYLDNTYEIVIAMEVLEHIPDELVTSFLETLSDRTSQGGRVIITVPSNNVPLTKKHFRHYDSQLFLKQLDSANTRLKIEKIEYIYREDLLTKIYKKISNNRLFDLEIHFLTKLVWKNIWNNNRFASRKTGNHLVISLSKH